MRRATVLRLLLGATRSFWRTALGVAAQNPARTFELLYDGLRHHAGWHSARRGFVAHSRVPPDALQMLMGAWQGDSPNPGLHVDVHGQRWVLPAVVRLFGPGGDGRGWSLEVPPTSLALLRAAFAAHRLMIVLPLTEQAHRRRGRL